MIKQSITATVCLMCGLLLICPMCESYTKQRNRILLEEQKLSTGGKMVLNQEEIVANKILMQRKCKELDYAYSNPRHFNFSKHYFVYRDQIKHSKVYQIIKRMPKAAVLHVHFASMMDADYMVKLTYEEHLYSCLGPDIVIYKTSLNIPDEPCPKSCWTLVKEDREKIGAEKYDRDMKRYFTLYTQDTEQLNANGRVVYQKFSKIRDTIKSLISYKPLFEKYLYDALEVNYNDGIMYIESRFDFDATLYELNGTTYNILDEMKLILTTTDLFKKSHPDFLGLKLVINIEGGSIEQASDALIACKSIKKQFPRIFAGIDINSHREFSGDEPLLKYVPLLLQQHNINFILTAGQTTWYGFQEDNNLFDALLLEPKRIGHALSLVKHPYITRKIMEKNIALEIQVICNSVKGLIRDSRQHPLGTYLAMGLPIVLSGDEPGLWGADPVSHDYYVTFVAIASRNNDLRMLKQLAMNSIAYSTMKEVEKALALTLFMKKWKEFVKSIVDEFSDELVKHPESEEYVKQSAVYDWTLKLF